MFRKLILCFLLLHITVKGFSQLQCTGLETITANPLPTAGTYLTGTRVTFCYTLQGWTEYGMNYLHGFLFEFGPGWDTSTFVVNSLPGSCDGKGNWKFFKTDTSLGNPPPNNTFGWGIYYDKGIGAFGPDGKPGNNQGDHTVTGSCVWNFCFSLTVKSICSGSDLTVAVKATGDGTTGAWSNISCPGIAFKSAASTCKPNCNMVLTATPSKTACAINNGGVKVTLTGGTPSYKYLWSNGEKTPDITGLGSGTYTLTVTDANQCTVSKSAVVVENNPVNITTSTMDISCFGFCDGSATVMPSGGLAPYTYLWQPAGNTQKISGLCAGSYSVTVSDANKCSRSADVTVNQFVSLVATPGSTPASCFGSSDGSASVSASYGVGPYAYKWSNGQTTTSINNLKAGIYHVTVTDSKGCSLDVTATVAEPPEINLNTAVKNVSCFGLSDAYISLNPSSGTAPYTYDWISGEMVNTLSNIPSGFYSVTVTDYNSCVRKSSFFITEPPVLGANFRQEPASCPEVDNGSAEVVAYGGVAPYTYVWKTNPVQTTAKVTNLSYGVYKVQISDLNGCKIELTDSVKALHLFKVNAGANKEIKKFEKTSLSVSVDQSGNYSIQWFPSADLNNDEAANPVASPTVTTTYVVIITNTDNGCKASDSVVVLVFPTDYLFVPNAFTPNGDGQNDTFFPIAGDLVEVVDFKIYNRWGQLVFNDPTSAWNGKFRGSDEPEGSYAYYVSYKNVNTSEVFRKQGNVTLMR